MERFTKIRLFIIITLLTLFASLTGYFEYLIKPLYQLVITYMPTPYTSFSFYLNSTIIMLSLCIGLLSAIDDERKKLWFYTSVITVIVGQSIIAIILGHINPVKLLDAMQIDSLWSFLTNFISIFLYNILHALAQILTGPTLILPYITTSNVMLQIFYYFSGYVSYYGFNGIILILGSFHMYFEIYAFLLSSIASIRVAINSFPSLLNMKNGFKTSLREIKDITITEVKNTVPKVIILLLIAAFLETAWDPFWINYWLQHII